MSSFEIDESAFERQGARPSVGPLPDITISPGGDAFERGGVAEPIVVRPDTPASVAVDGLSQAARDRHEAFNAGSQVSEQGEPEASEGVTEAGELDGGPKLYHVDRITKADWGSEGNAAEFITGHRAPLSRIAESGRRGEKQVMSITRSEGDGPIKIEVPASMVPVRAHVVPEKSNAGETATEPFHKWALLDCEQTSAEMTTEGGTEAAVAQGSEGFDVRRVLAGYEGRFKVVIEADPIDSAQLKEIKETTAYQLEAAQDSEGEDATVADLRHFQERLGEGKNTALFRVGIAIGAEREEDLDALVQHVKDSALPANRFTWRERTDTQGTMVKFDSARQALGAKADIDPVKAGTSEDSFLTAREFRTLAQFPPTPVPGLEVRATAETFAVERKIPEGVRSTRLGRALDNYGNEVPGKRGEVRGTDKEHLGVFGASGTGKTAALHTEIVETIADAYLRGEPVGVLLADCEKIGNHDRLADMLEAYRFPDGSGLPDEWKQVRRIRPGEEGIRAVIDPFRIAGNNSPAKQLEEAINTLSSGILTPEEHHIFVKYGHIGMKEATWAVGTDPEDVRPTNGGKYGAGSEYDGQEVIMPTMDMATPYIMRAIDEAQCEQKIKDNLRNYMSTEVAKSSTGVDQAVYQHGNALDGQAMVQAKGVTLVELGELSDAGKAIATSALMRLSISSLRALKDSPGDVHQIRFKFITDEATTYDRNKPAAAENAHYATYARGEGMKIVVAKTTGVDMIHHELLGNLRNIAAFNLTRREDLDAIAACMGNSRPDELKSLLTSVPSLDGMYYGPDMPTGPVRIRLDNPKHRTPADGRHNITDARDIVHMGIDPRVFDGYTKSEAAKMLRTTKEGAVVTAWTQLNVIAAAGNYSPVGLGDEWREKLTGYGDPRDIDKRDAAITQGVELAVKPRSEVPQRMEAAKEQVGMLLEGANGAGEPLEQRPPRVDRAMPQFRYRPVEAEITAAIENTPKLPHIDWYEKVHGDIDGNTAPQQLETVKRLREESLSSLAQMIGEVHSMSAENTNYVAREIAKQVGGYEDVEQGFAFVRKQIEKRLDRSLTNDEAANYDKAASKAKWLENIQKAGFPLAQADLQQYIDTREGIDLTKWNKPYGETFPSPQDGSESTVTLKDQLAFVQNKQREHNRAHRAGEVSLTNLVFAEHPSQGGYVWDRVAERLREASQHQPGRRSIFEQQQRRYDRGQLPAFELTELLRTNPDGAEEWSRIMKDLIFGNYFRMTPETREFIAGVINDTVKGLRNEAERRNKQSNGKETEGRA